MRAEYRLKHLSLHYAAVDEQTPRSNVLSDFPRSDRGSEGQGEDKRGDPGDPFLITHRYRAKRESRAGKPIGCGKEEEIRER